MPILSYIVPVYNTEKHLARCVDSILLQPLEDMELLLIDDGSQDSSSDICDYYAKRDSRIKVYHKVNGGVSSARNHGLDQAAGEYITFVDADDWLEPETISERTFEGEYDVIRIPCDFNTSGKRYQKDVICNNVVDARKLLVNEANNACWGRMYKRSIIGKMRFRLGMRMGEDILFFVDIFSNINTFRIIGGEVGYHYFVNPESAVSTIGLATDFELLVNTLHQHCKKGNQLSWYFLLGTCNYISDVTCNNRFYFGSFGIIEILRSPLSLLQKVFYLKQKAKSICHK